MNTVTAKYRDREILTKTQNMKPVLYQFWVLKME